MADQMTPEEGNRIYSERFKGKEGPECPIPKCAAPGRMICTGWLVFSKKCGAGNLSPSAPITAQVSVFEAPYGLSSRRS